VEGVQVAASVVQEYDPDLRGRDQIPLGDLVLGLLHDFKHAANGFQTQTAADWIDLLV
jgi:hypothetical protein